MMIKKNYVDTRELKKSRDYEGLRELMGFDGVERFELITSWFDFYGKYQDWGTREIMIKHIDQMKKDKVRRFELYKYGENGCYVIGKYVREDDWGILIPYVDNIDDIEQYIMGM